MPDEQMSRRRHRWIAPVIVLVVILAAGGYVALALARTPPAATAAVSAPGLPKPAAYVYTAPHAGESAVSVTGSAFPAANGMLGAGGGTAAVPMASISKLITAMVILEKKPLAATDAGPTITFSKADSDLYDKYYVLNASVSSMKTGSAMTESDALKVMLIASACNYAEAVSTWAFGSQANFLAATTSWLAANSLADTRMVEPTGVDSHNVSTPANLVAIGRLALANPLVAAIVTQSQAQVANVGEIQNTNELLGTDGVDGIKTGTLDSGSDLLFSSTTKIAGTAPLSVVGVILGGSSRETVDADARQILASIRLGFHETQVISKDQVMGKYTTPWGDSAKVVAASTGTLLVWSDTAITSTVLTKHIAAATDGTTVGSITYTAGSQKVTVPLVLSGSITAPDWLWRVTHPGG